MDTCCRECDKTSLDINLKGIRDFGGQWSLSVGYIGNYTHNSSRNEMICSGRVVCEPLDDMRGPIICLCDGNE